MKKTQSKSNMTIIKTSEFTPETWTKDYRYVLDYLRNHIETDYAQNTFLEIHFTCGEIVYLTLFDYLINLIMWYPLIQLERPISKREIFFPENLTKREIKRWIDRHVIMEYREQIDNTNMNMLCADLLDSFKFIRFFGFYLSNTISIADDIALMMENEKAYDCLHTSLAHVPIADIKREGQKITNTLMDIIKNTHWHGLSSVFRTGEIINPKQYREYAVNIGTKPNGKGGVIPIVINNSYLNGGLATLEANFVDYMAGRLADIIKSKNVGDSGDFARKLSLNNSDLVLHTNPNYVCDSVEFLPVTIHNEVELSAYKMRYFRFHENGMEHYIDIDYTKHKDLIGKRLLFRSPATCASASRSGEVCHRCYGKLSITNALVNIGVFAVKAFSSGLTQKLIGAKHVLDTIAKNIQWADRSADFITMIGNVIFLNPQIDFAGAFLVIEPESIRLENDMDNYNYNESVDTFYIQFPDGSVQSIMTMDSDPMYITNHLNTIIRHSAYNLNERIAIRCEDLIDVGIGLITIKNDDLSKTLGELTHLIDLASVTIKHTLESIIEEFLETSQKGDISLDSVHMEVIIANQIRSAEDILDKPDWSEYNAQYTILPLSNSLSNNPNVLISMAAGTLKPQLYNPLTFRKHKSSFIDTFFMLQPQQHLREEIKELTGTKEEKAAWWED